MVVTPAQHCEYAKYHRIIHFKMIKNSKFYVYLPRLKMHTHKNSGSFLESKKPPNHVETLEP